MPRPHRPIRVGGRGRIFRPRLTTAFDRPPGGPLFPVETPSRTTAPPYAPPWIFSPVIVGGIGGGGSTPGISFTDDFNRAGPGLGAAWTQLVAGYTINANQLECKTTNALHRVTVAMTTDNTYAQGVITAVGAFGTRVGVAVRVQDALNLYAAVGLLTTNRVWIYKRVAGVWTALQQYVNAVWPQTVRLAAVGGNLTVTIGGVPQAPFADATFPASGIIGVVCQQGSPDNAFLDDFAGGDV